jgi:hypothetical protein
MYSWVNILLEEAAFSRKKKQFNKSNLFYMWANLTDVITSTCRCLILASSTPWKGMQEALTLTKQKSHF